MLKSVLNKTRGQHCQYLKKSFTFPNSFIVVRHLECYQSKGVLVLLPWAWEGDAVPLHLAVLVSREVCLPERCCLARHSGCGVRPVPGQACAWGWGGRWQGMLQGRLSSPRWLCSGPLSPLQLLWPGWTWFWPLQFTSMVRHRQLYRCVFQARKAAHNPFQGCRNTLEIVYSWPKCKKIQTPAAG